ncbi:acid-sensing ion channel 4-B-like, partial [Stegodyphus dumicola]|uniref:acid-sensing ion channel 4-B-like n=1 Tax=Stegodyphus dumicola TaxID=202533 RepID=UPI0015AF60AF
LMLLLDAETEEFTEKRKQPGLILTVHSDNAEPDVHTDGIKIEPGYLYDIGVQQSITKLLPRPYATNCTNFSQLPWVSDDVELSPRLCSVRCSQHFQLKKCGYVTERLSLFYRHLPWDAKKITPDQKKCAQDIEDLNKGYCTSLCGLPCEDIRFEVAVSTNHLTENDVAQFYTDDKKKVTLQNRMRQLTLVRIYYKAIERKIYEHVPQYDNLELFSSLGGYSGIWLGFSLLNLCELLEIIVATLKFALSKWDRKLDAEDTSKPFHTLASKKLFVEAYAGKTLFPHMKPKIVFLKRRKKLET